MQRSKKSGRTEPVPGRGSDRVRLVASIGLIHALVQLTACATPLPPTEDARPGMHSGVWRGSFENDSFLFTDGNYTAGTKVDWISAETSRYAEGALARRLTSAGSFLPWMGDPQDEHYLGLGAGQLIFTPEDITQPVPAPDDHPYAGVLFFDAALHAYGDDTLTSYKLMLGVVGENSGAETAQEFLHDLNNLAEPRGWEQQLEDEPVINLSFERHRRSLFGTLGDSLEWDLTPNVGLAAGTYLTGLNVGARGRIGSRLPIEFGRMSPRTAFESPLVSLEKPGRDPAWYLFCAADLYGVAHFLPVDGNVFRSGGASSERRDLVVGAEIGVAVHVDPLAASIAYTVVSDTYSAQNLAAQGAVISLAFFVD